ncbi:MAG: hypothetical protein HY281_07900 [Nitrospirae bacterium]|nr:hypothetical protein [Nitrospirota bacterium]
MSNSKQTVCFTRACVFPQWVRALFIVAICACPGLPAQADVGLLPTPTFQGVQTQALVSKDPTTQIYTYTYTVSNPSSNTGQIWLIQVDLSTKYPKSFTPPFDSTGFTIPLGVSTAAFDDLVSILSPSMKLPPSSGYLVAYGQQVPSGWGGGLSVQGFALFGALSASGEVVPGSSITGLTLQSRGVPTLVRINAQPDWKLVLNSESDDTDEVVAAAAQVSDSLTVPAVTLGPSGVSAGSYGHWDQLRDDLNQATLLGWIPDPVFANTLVTQLASARQALDANDGTTAKTRLNTVIQTISASTVAQRRAEVAALVLCNAQALRDNTSDTPIPFEPRVTLTPGTSQGPIGVVQTLTASVLNFGDPTHPPVPGFSVRFLITDGPNSGFSFNQVTDATGQAPLSITSSTLGTDHVTVTAGIGSEVFEEQAFATVNWTGGPDLVVPLFVPPVLNSKGGNPIKITEWTQNIGTVAAPPSVTQYYLSTTNTVDPLTARVIGQRAIPGLAPGDISKGPTTPLTLPADLPAGMYTLAACADAPDQIVELQEQNNCSFNKLSTSQSVVVPQAFFGTPNDPPICTNAVPSTKSLWPPNHKLATVSVQGVTDPNNDPVTIKITAITQDEPVNGLGDGDTAPDGLGVGTAQAQLRQERSGTGNGRVYAIRFQADDGSGGTCTGTVSVGVPHDQGKGSIAIDDGQNYDSTKTQ